MDLNNRVSAVPDGHIDQSGEEHVGPEDDFGKDTLN